MLMQTILVGLVALIGYLDHFTGKSMIQRPVVMGPLVGLVLGDLPTGLAVGGTLELAFMGNVAIGAAIPPEITAGGILGTAFAITSGSGADVAVALAVPIATLALFAKNLFYLIIRPQLLHVSDAAAERGDLQGCVNMHHLSYWSYVVVMTLIVALSFYVGSPVIQTVIDAIPQFVMDGISIASGILPALGFAMLANMLINEKIAPYYFLGFLLAAYLNIPVLGIALMGGVLVILLVRHEGEAPAVAAAAADDEEDF